MVPDVDDGPATCPRPLLPSKLLAVAVVEVHCICQVPLMLRPEPLTLFMIVTQPPVQHLPCR